MYSCILTTMICKGKVTLLPTAPTLQADIVFEASIQSAQNFFSLKTQKLFKSRKILKKKIVKTRNYLLLITQKFVELVGNFSVHCPVLCVSSRFLKIQSGMRVRSSDKPRPPPFATTFPHIRIANVAIK